MTSLQSVTTQSEGEKESESERGGAAGSDACQIFQSTCQSGPLPFQNQETNQETAKRQRKEGIAGKTEKLNKIQQDEKQEKEGRKEGKKGDRIRWMLGEKNVEEQRERARGLAGRLPAAPLNGLFQLSRQTGEEWGGTGVGGFSIQLPARNQVKLARLVHLHKRYPKRTHTHAHTE